MTNDTELSAFWLLDGSALTPSELSALKQAPQIRWVYDHIADEQAMSVGPVLVAPCSWADELAKQWQADEARAWAVASLDTPAEFDALAQHLVALRYLQTQDGQRYYLRYADSRCLTALNAVLTEGQQYAVAGPVLRWNYWDRELQGQAISFGQDAHANVVGKPPLPMRLTDEQLGGLLQRCWPDQLLYSVSEQMPEAGRSLALSQRHACAQRVCDWLISAKEDRYPVQVNMLAMTLSESSPSWDDHQWAAMLRTTHQTSMASHT